MKHSKDPFEAAIEEEQEESPVRGRDGSEDGPVEIDKTREEEEERAEAKKKDENEEEEEENMEVEFTKYSSGGAYTVKKANRMQTILSQFTEDQMSRYESFRRSGFKKLRMEKLVESITGGKKMNDTTNIVVCGIAKMFVGELVETARVVMRERKESGRIRPCHIRESYRRLKLQGKVPQRSVPRLFH